MIIAIREPHYLDINLTLIVCQSILSKEPVQENSCIHHHVFIRYLNKNHIIPNLVQSHQTENFDDTRTPQKGSATNLKQSPGISGEKGGLNSARDDQSSSKYQRWGSLARRNLDFTDSKETQKPASGSNLKRYETVTKSISLAKEPLNRSTDFGQKDKPDTSRREFRVENNNTSMREYRRANSAELDPMANNLRRDGRETDRSDSKSRAGHNYYHDEFTKPYSARGIGSSPLSNQAARRKKNEITLKVTETAPTTAEKTTASYASPVKASIINLHHHTSDTRPKDSETSSTSSDALLCDPCINELLARKRQKFMSAAALADLELQKETERDLKRLQERDERRRKEHDSKMRDVAFENKRSTEEYKNYLKELKERDQNEYRRQIEEIEGTEAAYLEKCAERDQKYRKDLLDQMEEDQRRRQARREAEKAGEVGFELKGDKSRFGKVNTKQDLLDQMQEKRDKDNEEWYNKTVKTRLELEQKKKQEDEAMRRFQDKEKLKKKEHLRAIQEDIEAAKGTREHDAQSKWQERDRLRRALEEEAEMQNAQNKQKHAQMDAYRQELLRQMEEKRNSKSPQQRVEESSCKIACDINEFMTLLNSFEFRHACNG